MPECHKCRWNDEPPTDEKATACTNCFMSPSYVNHKGKVFVSMDAAAESRHGGSDSGQTIAEIEASLQQHRAEVEADAENGCGLPDCCQRTAILLLDYLRGLTEREIKVLMEVAHGKNLAQVARDGTLERHSNNRGREELTRQSICIIWRRIVEKKPEIWRLLALGKPPKAKGAQDAKETIQGEGAAAGAEGRGTDATP